MEVIIGIIIFLVFVLFIFQRLNQYFCDHDGEKTYCANGKVLCNLCDKELDEVSKF